MFSVFLNPLTIIAGGVLVSTPIIIHLINRIRFRRVKWAAMEFLLKAQKKMRRKKILEQLLLLFLRCLLVFLIGLLFARFTGCDSKGKESRPTTHLVILDDTPSMADGWRAEDGKMTTAYDEAKITVYKHIMPAAAEATTHQTLHVLRLSELENPYPAGTKLVDGSLRDRSMDEVREEARVNGANIEKMKVELDSKQVSTVRRSLVDGLRKGKELLAARASGDTAQVVHVISDLRAIDWAADGPAISELLKEYKDNGATVHLIDVANPARKPDRKSPPFSDNLAIVELKPRNRVVSVNQLVEIEVSVMNFGSTEVKNVQVAFFLNGLPRVIQTKELPSLPPNQLQTITVEVTMTQTGTKDKPLDRFNLITAALKTPEPGGLSIDNVRHTVVEVRDAVRVLVVDGRTVEGGTDLRERPEGDSYYLRTLLLQTKAQELGNIRIDSREAKELENVDLRPYSAVYLMNVPTLTEAAVTRLEKYVEEGGGIGVFLGPDVKSLEYNARMYREANGFFPVPLAPEPTKELTPELKLARELAFSKRVLLREDGNKDHAALKRIYKRENGELLKDDGVERFFYFANIDHHWPVPRRGRWREDKLVRELYCLPNETPIAAFEERSETLVSEIKKKWGEPKFESARKYLEPLLQKIRETPKQSVPLSVLARYLDQLLCDQINDGDESEPVLREFWNQPELAETRKLAAELRDETKFGDPLYIVKDKGRGRVAVMTTDAGGTYSGKKVWNDWSSLKASPSWVVLVGEMHKYLTGGGDEENRSVGKTFTAEFDFARYDPNVTVHFLSAAPANPSTPKWDDPLVIDRKDLGKLVMDAPAQRPFKLTFTNTRTPGAYLFALTRKRDVAAAAPAAPGPAGGVTPDPLGDQDFVGVAFNVDALAEGDLRRANTDDLDQQTGKLPVHNLADTHWVEAFKQKPTDLSSGRWLYLLILLVLLAEQAWAVRISYHTRPEDLELLAPSAAAVFAHHAVPPPASAGTPADAPAAAGTA
jgi:hypothetical protein